MLLAGAFTVFTDVAPGGWRGVDITRAAGFVLLAVVLSVRSTSSFSLVGRNKVLDDELTRANRASAARYGFWALMLGVLASFVANIWMPLSLAQVAPVLVALGAATATLRFVTFAWNQAVSGGGLSSTGDALLLRNVILAGDAAAGGSEECAISGAADIASSLWQGTSCGATGTNGNQPATDPLLSPLGFSCAAGTTLELTRTHDLDASSPAIDAGVPLGGGNAFMDQRTVLRPQGLAPDIGAVEFIMSSCPWLFRDGFERGNTYSWSSRVD